MPPATHYTQAPPATAEGEAYAYLLDAICKGRYAKGDRLVAEEIASEVGMSRMPVREAFRRLAAEGLVTLRPNRGAVVSGLDMDDVREVFEMRSALEGLAVRLAVPNLTDRDIASLERLLEEMEEYRDDGSEWVTRHRTFHEALCSYARRPRLMRQIHSLYSTIEPPMRLWLQFVDTQHSTRETHQMIIDVLRARDPEQAERLIRNHIESTVPALIDFLESTSS